MAARPLISVLIPSFNYARYLPTAIESVLRQDFRDFELLISDDGSNDESVEVIRGYAARDPRIRYHFHSPNLGIPHHWNWCLEAARGEFIKFLFADDCFTFRHSLGRMVESLERHPRAVLAACARLIIDERSQPVEVWNPPHPRGPEPGTRAIARCLWQEANLIGEPSAVLFRRDPTGRGFDALLRQQVDLEFWFHLLQQGEFVYDPEPLCAFRVHPAQQTLRNVASDTGPFETLHLVGRYLHLMLNAAEDPVWRHRQRRVLYRCLHYSRKRVAQTATIAAAQSALQARLPGPWYSVCWVQHRMAKPFDNLSRFLRRRAGRDPDIVLPSHLRIWHPLAGRDAVPLSQLEGAFASNPAAWQGLLI
jgi:hypothetical protein